MEPRTIATLLMTMKISFIAITKSSPGNILMQLSGYVHFNNRGCNILPRDGINLVISLIGVHKFVCYCWKDPPNCREEYLLTLGK